MFDEAYTKLDIDETAQLLDHLNKSVEGSTFDPLETTILAIDIPFYPGYQFLNIADHATNPPLQRYVMQKKGAMEFHFIDWRHQTIQDFNAAAPIVLTEENVFDYVRFYYSFVKAYEGRFTVCESSDAIKWKEEPLAEVKQIANQIKPMEIASKTDDKFMISVYMTLKDRLFIASIIVDKNGSIGVSDYEVLAQNLPVIDGAIDA